MQTVGLRNFKSYQDTVVAKFSPRLNIILGSNGKGKSNFFSSLSFLFSNRIHLNSNEWSNCLFRGVDGPNDDGITVKSLINVPAQNQEDHNHKNKTVELSRCWKNDHTEDFCVNQKSHSKEEYDNYLESLGFNVQNPYNIIEQGKINNVARMSSHQIFNLLQDATGLKKFVNKIKQSTHQLDSLKKEKKQIQQTLDQLKTTLDTMEDKKVVFQLMSLQQKANKIKSRRMYHDKMVRFEKEKGETKHKYQALQAQLEKIKQQEKTMRINHENLQQEMRILQQKIRFLLKEDASQLKELENGKIMGQKQFQVNLKEVTTVNKQLKKIEAQVEKMNIKIDKERKSLDPIEQKYQFLKNTIAIASKNTNKEQLIKDAKNYIKQRQNMMQSIESELQKIDKRKSQFNVRQRYQKQHKDFLQAKERLETLRFEFKESKMNQIELYRKKNQIEAQLQIISNHKHQLSIKMKNVLSNIDPRLYEQLQKQKIGGVYGFVIEFLKIDENLLFAYELADIKKLCSLIVQDQKAAEAVIKLNKDIKGRMINIIPLNFIRKTPLQNKKYPNVGNASPLTSPDFIKVHYDTQALQYQNFPESFETDVKKLINNTFCKYMVTETYEVGLKIAKQYHLNCITGDREIVFSEGYLCKVGRQQRIGDARTSYLDKYKAKLRQQNSKRKTITQIEKQLKQIQEQQIKIGTQLKAAQNMESSVKRRIAELVDIKRTYQKIMEEQIRLLNEKQSYQQDIHRKQLQIKDIENKKSVHISPQQFQNVQKEYLQKRNRLNQELSILNKLEQKYEQLSKKQHDLKTIIQQQKKLRMIDEKQENSRGSPFISAQKMIQKLTNELQMKRKANIKVQKKLIQIQEKRIMADEKTNIIKQSLLQIDLKANDIEKRLKQIKQIQESMEQIQQRSNSLSRNPRIRQQIKNQRRFSIKDQLALAKFTEISQQFRQQIKQYDQILQSQKKVRQLFDQYQSQGRRYLEEIVTKFERNFIQIFSRIVQGGNASVKYITRKVDAVTGQARKQNILDIRVSFREQAPMQKWQHFSGGQKTVVSLAIIMAIQRCEPSPFYVLDQVDSALDSNYLQKVLNLIVEQSKNCQYFMTSFKKQILEIPQQIAQFYVVQYENRKSKLKKVRVEEARNFLNTIVTE